jgi:hypothetical protein
MSARSKRAKFLAPLALALSLFGMVRALAQEPAITKVALFSSGVAYFEYRGRVTGDATLSLPFSAAEVDDALKSLVVWDPASGAAPRGAGSPSVSYPSLEGLDDSLRGLRLDLTGSPKVADLLARLRGAELSVEAPEKIVGRIVSIEPRPTGKDGAPRTTVVLLTSGGVRAIALDDMVSFRFTDPGIASDFDRALALILGARDADRRSLDLRLPGTTSREVALGYVVASPVWKVSYRLDLSGEKPWLQGWAIVDNPSQSDWKEVSLSLVSGRPVSFIQNLYAPLRLSRPVLPLSIAGAAEARSYESGFSEAADYAGAEAEELYAPSAMGAAKSAAPMAAKRAESAPRAAPSPALADSAVETAVARTAGDQFEFTVKGPVTLERRRSAMLPLVAGALEAEKLSIWSPSSGSKNPMLGARLTNSLGMKLPAGPITVFDGGVYAGDALIEFLPEKDRRIIVYGQDLSVTAEDSRSSAQETVGVKVTKGVLVFSRRTTWTRSYEFRNASGTPRKILVEHPITSGAELVAPAAFDERTDSVYRFALALPAGGQKKLEVRERSPSQESVALSSLSADSFLYYASSSEIPAKIQDALRKAIELRGKADGAKKALAELVARKTELSSDQSRIRQNLDAVGRDSSQGQQYLKRLMDSEAELDALASKTAEARRASQDAQTAYDNYLGALNLN